MDSVLQLIQSFQRAYIFKKTYNCPIRTTSAERTKVNLAIGYLSIATTLSLGESYQVSKMTLTGSRNFFHINGL